MNRPSGVGFDEAESLKPHLDIALLQGQDSVTEYPLRVAAFSNVFSLSLFFSEADGDEVTRIYYIGFKGDARQHSKDSNTRMEVPAENAADAALTDAVSEKTNPQLRIR